MKIKLKNDIIKRVLKTMLQTLVGSLIGLKYIVADINNIEDFKQVIYSVIISVISAGLCALMNIEVKKEQKGGDNFKTFNDYIKSRIGKNIDYDRAYGFQCVDLIDDYIVNFLGLNKCFYGNAKEWALNYNNSVWLKNNFDLIKVDFKNTKIKTGDIGIRTGGKYGHIFIVEYVNNNIIYYYDQNADGKGQPVTPQMASFTPYVIDYILRPKKAVKTEIKTIFKANATILTTTDVYDCDDYANNHIIGIVKEKERVKVLAQGIKNSIIQYHINDNNNYKVGIIRNSRVKKD